MPDPIRRNVSLLSGLVTLALGASVMPANASEEVFRLSPHDMMLNDDTGDSSDSIEGQTGVANGRTYTVVQGHAVAEGDIVLGRVNDQGKLRERAHFRGLTTTVAFDRWPDGVVPYDFDVDATDVQRRNIARAIDSINANTRMLLVPRETVEDLYDFGIRFTHSASCASYVGRNFDDPLYSDAQPLWVADSCSTGSIIHEISHAIGLFHEHTRADRDSHVTYLEENVRPSAIANFNIVENGAEDFGPYDYGSIMHYGPAFFTRNGEPTLVAPADIEIGQRVALSDGDITAIDTMYATDLSINADYATTEFGLEAELTVTNRGNLGANTLEIRAAGPEGTDWVSVSADSGWDCLAFGPELRCTRPRLVEAATSQFTIVADAATTSEEEIAIRVYSRTLDIAETNNDVNGDSLPKQVENSPEPAIGSAAPIDDDMDEEPRSVPEEEELASGNAAEGEASNRSVPDSLSSSDGGGGLAGTLTVLALSGFVGARRRRRPG